MLIKEIVSASMGWFRVRKQLSVIVVDIFLCIFAAWGVCLMHFGFQDIPSSIVSQLSIFSIVISIPIFFTYGLYREIFRHFGEVTIVAVAKAISIYAAIFTLIYTVIGVEGVPRSIGVVQPLLYFALVLSSRVFAKYWLEGLGRDGSKEKTWSRVLIYGAGQAGRQIAKALQTAPGYRCVGFLDDEKLLQGRRIDGLNVYDPYELDILVKHELIAVVLLAMPSITRTRHKELIEWLQGQSVHVRTLPSLTDLASGRVKLADVREVDVKDLLPRDPVPPDISLLSKNIHNKVVLVTGAGGSIGSELCRQIIKCRPKCLLLVDNNEFSLYAVHKMLLSMPESRVNKQGASPSNMRKEEVDAHIGIVDIDIVPLLASVQDEHRIEEIMTAWLPETVYHAAAYKHVPLVEYNPAEGVRNNVWGTWICARVAEANGVENFILISSDKAVRPTNVMGASKRLAEMILQALSAVNSEKVNQRGIYSSTCFSMVRFGNVLGSSGSVVPLFKEQIVNGGPITLTHRDITRFFMTISEAAQLVIQASALGNGGDVFILDMGQPVRIYDLAKRMINLSGFAVKDAEHPGGNIEIQITGLRPGEKLYEELLIGNEPEETQHPRIMRATEKFLPHKELMTTLNELKLALDTDDIPVVLGLLAELVDDYKPLGEVMDYVYLKQNKGK